MVIIKRIIELIKKLISYKTVLVALATYVYIHTASSDWKSFAIYILFLIWTLSVRELIKVVHIIKKLEGKDE